jgi:enamine deaminase RidA (YjgF/YER057c/UK114 family)
MIRRTGPWGGILHEVVEHKGVLYFGGLVAEDLALDMAGQAEDCLRQADQLLAAHGSDRTRLLSALIFVADLAEKPAFDAVWKRWLEPAHLPARAAVGAGALGPGVRVEIVLTAAAGEG